MRMIVPLLAAALLLLSACRRNPIGPTSGCVPPKHFDGQHAMTKECGR